MKTLQEIIGAAPVGCSHIKLHYLEGDTLHFTGAANGFNEATIEWDDADGNNLLQAASEIPERYQRLINNLTVLERIDYLVSVYQARRGVDAWKP